MIPGTRRPLTPEMIDLAERLFFEGEPVGTIASKLKVGNETFARLRDHMGWKRGYICQPKWTRVLPIEQETRVLMDWPGGTFEDIDNETLAEELAADNRHMDKLRGIAASRI